MSKIYLTLAEHKLAFILSIQSEMTSIFPTGDHSQSFQKQVSN